MTDHNNAVHITVGDPDEECLRDVRVEGPTGPLWADRVDLRTASARESAAKAIVVAAPGLDAADIAARLLGAATERRGGHGQQPRRSPKAGNVAPAGPFPTHLLPEGVQEYVRALSYSMSIDESVVGLAVWACLGGAIGLAREAVVWNDGWTEPAAIWGAIVVPSGGRKSPALTAVLEPVVQYQLLLKDAFEDELVRHDIEYRVWEQAEKKRIKGGTATAPPEPPHIRHVYASDTTVEAIVDMFKHKPHGILAYYDELTAFFGQMGRYSGKAQADLALWLSMHRVASIKVDRKVAGTTIIERALTSVIGGIQPRILRENFDDSAFACGLVARFLFVMPSAQVKELRDGVDDDVKDDYWRVVHTLLELKQEEATNALGRTALRAKRLRFAPDCEAFLRDYVRRWSGEALEECETIDAAMSKLEAYAIRFALIRRVVREACSGCGTDDPILLSDLEAGVAMVEWFRAEFRRVMQALDQDLDPGKGRVIESRCAIMRSLGGAVTVAEWRKRKRRLKVKAAEQELQEVIDAGFAEWRDRPTSKKGGRPTKECALIDPTVLDPPDDELEEDEGGELDEAPKPAPKPSIERSNGAEAEAAVELVEGSEGGVIGVLGFRTRVHAQDRLCLPDSSAGMLVTSSIEGVLDTRVAPEPLKVRLGPRSGRAQGDRPEDHPQPVADFERVGIGPGGVKNGGEARRVDTLFTIDAPIGERFKSDAGTTGSQEALWGQARVPNPQNPQNLPTVVARTRAAAPLESPLSPKPPSSVPETSPCAAPTLCTPHGLDHPLEQGAGATDLAAELLRELPGSRIVAAATDVVAIELLFTNLGSGGQRPIATCYACRGTTWWRRRDGGRGQPGDWVCAGCHEPAIAEELIERHDATGGAR